MLFGKSPEEKLYKMICDYYDKQGISYQKVDEDRLTLAVYRDRDIPVNLFAAVEEKPLSLHVRGQLPFTVPEDSREMMIPALQALNQRLPLGSFQMRADSGQLNYYLNLPLVGMSYDEKWLENVLNEAKWYVTHRDESILALLQGEMTFEEFEKKVR